MGMTPFKEVYNLFLSKITDDMYIELTEEETNSMLAELLISAIPHFEFPRVNIFDYSQLLEEFNVELSFEEKDILSIYMIVEWLGQQLANIDNIRQKYSGTDFKFTSQAAHIKQLTALKEKYEQEGFHLQRLYKRRKVNENGKICSTLGQIMEII